MIYLLIKILYKKRYRAPIASSKPALPIAELRWMLRKVEQDF